MQSKLITILIVAILFSMQVNGQKGIYSPYSRYGFGEIVHQSLGNTTGYGSISSGIRMDDVINYSNPASYTAQDTNSFIFDVGLTANSALQRSTNDQITRRAMSFDHLAIGFPIIRWWKSSIGIVPLSQVGYHVKNTTNPQDIDEMVNSYEGEGGIRQFYIGNSFDLTDKLSVGLNYFYLFGNTTYNSIASLPQDPYSGIFQKNMGLHITGSRFQAGIQYEWNLSENYDLITGASYDFKADLNMDKDYEFFSSYQYSDNQGVTRHDTIDRIKYTTSPNTRYPEGWKAGFALQSPGLTFGADFKYQNWSALDEFDNLSDSYAIHAGAQYIPDIEALRNYLKRINYRVGAFYEESYVNLNNQQLNNYGITFGLGLPLPYNKTKFNISLELGKRGTTEHNLIEENYATVHFNVTFYDFWFIKRKYQ